MRLAPPKGMFGLPLVLLVAWTSSGPSVGQTSDGNAPMVVTDLGTLIGSTVEVRGVRVRQFLGVPYATPPTGELRFKRAEPPAPWSEPLLATRHPPACVQFTRNPFPWYDGGPGKSEDCLYLNVWTPEGAAAGRKRAVLFWIFGGGFFVGSIRQGMYSGEALSALGDIVVVTVNYRLGSLGFLYSGTDDAPGNVGLWDIVSGLRWVRDHIGAFGGDASRVTVSGASAGSIAAGLLAVSPLSRGLYSRTVMQSGSPAYTLADDGGQSERRGQGVAEILNCANRTFTLRDHPGDVVRCLRDVDAMELAVAEYTLAPHSSRSFVPRFGDDILPVNPREAIMAGNFQNTDLLIGNNKDEGSFQITTSLPHLFGFFGEKDPVVNKSTGEGLLRNIFSGLLPDPESVVRHYLPEDIPEDDHETVRFQVYTASGDFSLLCPSVYFAEKFAANGNRVYYYMWSHRPSNTPWEEWMGTPHYTEVEFLFGLPVKDPESYEEEEVALSMDLIHKWSNFVKHGKPTEEWPLYTRRTPVFVYLGFEAEAQGTGPHPDHCDFFRPHFGFLRSNHS